jgi:nitronate monooxygenase
MGQFCIDKQLGHALSGEVDKGLFFRGAAALPFGEEIRPVRDLMAYLLGNGAVETGVGSRQRSKARPFRAEG